MEKSKKGGKSPLGEKIANLALKRGFAKPSDFANHYGINIGTFNDLIYGKTKIMPDSLIKVSEALGVEPWELLKPPESADDVRTVAEPQSPYQARSLDAEEIADLIRAYGKAESSLRASIRRQLGLQKSDREAFERHVLSYREQRDKIQIKDRKGE